MLPTPKSAHKDAALTNLSIGYKNQEYIADRIFPNVPVKKRSDYFFKFLKGDWFRNVAGVRGPGGTAPRAGYKLTDDTFSCVERAFGHPVPIELINNADSVLTPLATGVRFAMNAVLLSKEIVVAALCTTHTGWTTSDDVAAGWVGDTNSTFWTDIEAKKETIRQLIGRYPNVLQMDSKTWMNIRKTPELLDRIVSGGTQGKPADITKEMVAALFEIDEVIVGSSIYSSDEETVAGTEFTAVDIWEENATKGSALLFYRPTVPTIETPAAGYVFNWRGDGGMPADMVESDVYREVRRYWEDAPKQWVIEASENYAAKITCADAGCSFYDTIVT